MGRPKGSKNKPRVTTAIIGEVISKPKSEKKVYVEEPHSTPVSPKDPRVAHMLENGDKMVDEGAPAPVLSDEEVNNAALKEAQQTVTKRRKLSVKDKGIEEKLDFLFADMKSLRNYVSRLEDALNVRRNDITNEPEPVVTRKRRSKSLTKMEHHDKIEPLEDKETVNETE